MGTEIVKVSDWTAMQQNIDQLHDVVLANVGDPEAMSVFDLERIQIPTAGGLAFPMPGGETVKSFLAVVAFWTDCRSYWSGAFSGGEPPQCSSLDGKTGRGDPGGDCGLCPMAQWGSDGGKGQACKAMRRLFLMRPDSLLPQVLTLPPTSIRPCKRYMIHLLGMNHPYWGVVTEFTLERKTNPAGIAYSVIQMAVASELDAEKIAKARAYGEAFRAMASMPLGSDDYAAPSADEGIDL